MPLVYADRVQETTLTTGTGPLTLLGPVAGFTSFSVIGTGNQTYYVIVDDTAGTWEVGLGTYSPGALSRDSVLASSNANALVSFGVGTKIVFSTAAAQFFSNALSTAVHASINHTGIPGVPAPETFTAPVHAVLDHTGIPGVPAPESFTNAVHAATNHTGIPGVGDLSTAAHAALNHTGIPGVGDLSTAAHAALNHELIPGVAAMNQQLLTTVITGAGITAYTIAANTLTADGDVLVADLHIVNQSGVTTRTLDIRVDPVGPGVSHTLLSAYSIASLRVTDIKLRLIRTGVAEGILLLDLSLIDSSTPGVPTLFKARVLAGVGTLDWSTNRLLVLQADGGSDLVLRHRRITRQRSI